MNDSPKQPAADVEEPSWISDPEVIVFAGDPPLAVGATREHGLGDRIRGVFPRAKEEVGKELEQRVGQLEAMVKRVPREAGGFVLDEVSFELGFSAEGRVVFVAQAGVTTTIAVKFKRKD